MRRIRYSVAMSLDGYIAGPQGEIDWIIADPEVDFGELFRRLLEADLVDTVEVAIIPVLLGDGIRLLPAPAQRTKLQLTEHRICGTGIVRLEYSVSTSSPRG